MNRIVLVVLAVFCDLAGFGMAFPDIALRLRGYGLSQSIAGLILASYFVVQFIVSPHWGRLSDRIGRRPVAVTCTAISALSMIVYAFSRSFEWILASRILAGVAAANISVVQAYFADVSSPEQRTAAMGKIGAAVSAGLIGGPAIGGFLATNGSPLLLGLVAGGLSALGALFLWFGLPSAPKVSEEKDERTKGRFLDFRLLKDVPRLPGLFALAVLSWFSLACLEGTFVPLLNQMFHWPKEFLGLAFDARKVGGAAFGYESLIAVILQVFLVPRLAAKKSGRTFLFVGYPLMGIGLVLTPFAPEIWVLFLFSTVYAFGQSIADPTINAMVSHIVPDDRQGEVFGLMQGARSLGFWIGPLLGGFLFDLRPSYPYLLAGLVCMAAAIGVSVIVGRHAHPSSA